MSTRRHSNHSSSAESPLPRRRRRGRWRNQIAFSNFMKKRTINGSIGRHPLPSQTPKSKYQTAPPHRFFWTTSIKFKNSSASFKPSGQRESLPQTPQSSFY